MAVNKHLKTQLFNLSVGDTFTIKISGRPYTLHCKVIEESENDTSRRGERYIIAVHNNTFYAFYNHINVIKVD